MLSALVLPQHPVVERQRVLRQLEQLDHSDWKDLNVTMGLKTAIKAELMEGPNAADGPESAVEIPEKVRRFLLMPGEDGKEPDGDP